MKQIRWRDLAIAAAGVLCLGGALAWSLFTLHSGRVVPPRAGALALLAGALLLWLAGQRVPPRSPKTARTRQVAGIACLAVLLPLFWAAALGLVVSRSPGGVVVVLWQNPMTGTVTAGGTQLEKPRGALHIQWLTQDTGVATCLDESYYYQGALLCTAPGEMDGPGLRLPDGTWRENEDMQYPGWCLIVKGDKIRVIPPDGYNYFTTQNPNKGALPTALLLPDNVIGTQAYWAVALPDGSNPAQEGGQLILWQLMSALEPVTLTYYSEAAQQADAANHLALYSPKFSGTVDWDATQDGVYFTWDGGASFTGPEIEPEDWQDTLYFYDDGLPSAMVRQDEQTAACLYGADTVRCAYTQDRGATWQSTVVFRGETGDDIWAGFAPDDTGYAARSTPYTPASGGAWELSFSFDQGQSWQRCAVQTEHSNQPLLGVCVADAGHAVLSLQSGQDNDWPYLLATADGGASWVEISLPWTDSGLPYLYSATGLSLGADRRWRLTLTQGTYGEKSAVFSAPALQGPWQWEE